MAARSTAKEGTGISEAGQATSVFVVGAAEAGERLDRVVAGHCKELSRTRAQELIEASLVLVDGHAAKGSSRVREGQRVSVEERARPPMTAEAEAIPLEVLYEDDDVIVINKAAGMTVHAGAGNPTGTLVNALLGRGQGLSQAADLLRPGIVHRLDKDTSGAIVVAKNDFAHAKVAEDFRQRVVKKTYLALVQGVLGEERGRIELAISRDPLRRTRMTDAAQRDFAERTRGADRLACAGARCGNDVARSAITYWAHAPDPGAFCGVEASGGGRHFVWRDRTIACWQNYPAGA